MNHAEDSWISRPSRVLSPADWDGRGGEASGRQVEQWVDALILLANIIAADPPRLPLPDHVHRLVSLDRPAGSLLRSSPSFSLPATHANVATHPILFSFSGEILERYARSL
jgi:hypothetical protein